MRLGDQKIAETMQTLAHRIAFNLERGLEAKNPEARRQALDLAARWLEIASMLLSTLRAEDALDEADRIEAEQQQERSHA